MNAEKGRVPNIVYGYNKTIGDYFNLEINKEEAKVVKQIYKWYTEEGYGAAKIANVQLKKLIQKIEVDKEGNVDIYLRLLGDLGLDETVLIEDASSSVDESNQNSANKTAPNCNDHTCGSRDFTFLGMRSTRQSEKHLNILG